MAAEGHTTVITLAQAGDLVLEVLFALVAHWAVATRNPPSFDQLEIVFEDVKSLVDGSIYQLAVANEAEKPGLKRPTATLGRGELTSSTCPGKRARLAAGDNEARASRLSSRIDRLQQEQQEQQQQQQQPPAMDSTSLGPGWSRIPRELWDQIHEYLGPQDAGNLRLTCRHLETMLVAFFFEVSIPFTKGFYSTTCLDDLNDITPSTFHAHGSLIRKLTVSFDFNEEILAWPLAALKRPSPLHDVWFQHTASYRPDPHQFFYKTTYTLSCLATEDDILVEAFDKLDHMTDFTLSLRSGLGWLNGSDLTDYAKIRSRNHSVLSRKAWCSNPKVNYPRSFAEEFAIDTHLYEKINVFTAKMFKQYSRLLFGLFPDSPEVPALLEILAEYMITHPLASAPPPSPTSDNIICSILLFISQIDRKTPERLKLDLDPDFDFYNADLDIELQRTRDYLIRKIAIRLKYFEDSLPSDFESFWSNSDLCTKINFIRTREDIEARRSYIQHTLNELQQLYISRIMISRLMSTPRYQDPADGELDPRSLPVDGLRVPFSYPGPLASVIVNSNLSLSALSRPGPISDTRALIPHIVSDGHEIVNEDGLQGYGSHFHERVKPNELSGPQKILIHELLHAQRRFLSSLITYIVTENSSFSNLRKIGFVNFSSNFLKQLDRKDLWVNLKSVKDLTLLVSPAWRDFSISYGGYLTDEKMRPSIVVDEMTVLLFNHIHRLGISTLKIGFSDGGEHAPGIYARNQNILPAPISLFRENRTVIVKLNTVTNLTLVNCWVMPNILVHLVKFNKGLKILKLDSVSLVAFQGLGFPIGTATLSSYPQVVWALQQDPLARTYGHGLPHQDSLSRSAFQQHWVVSLGDQVTRPLSDYNAAIRCTGALRCSWVTTIHEMMPGVVPHFPPTAPGATNHKNDENLPEQGLEVLEMSNCGTVELGHQALNMSIRGYIANRSWVESRRGAIEKSMLDIADIYLGTIIPRPSQPEQFILRHGLGFRYGWSHDLEEESHACREDGQSRGGTGRFSGRVEAVGIGELSEEEQDRRRNLLLEELDWYDDNIGYE